MTTYLIRSIVEHIAQTLSPLYEKESAQSVAWRIVEHCSGLSQAQLLINQKVTLDSSKIQEILNALLYEHKPLDYIIGTIPFLNLTLHVKPPFLIPRPETEWWCDLVIQKIKPFVLRATAYNPFMVLDMCTGTGCLGLAIAHAFKGYPIQVHLIDNAPEALSLAQENAKQNNIASCSFILSNLYTKVPDTTYDIIISNPPYIALNDYKDLEPSVRLWEDKNALIGGIQGTEVLEKIIYEAPRHLRTLYDCGQLWCEIGHNQAHEVKQFFTDVHFHNIQVLYDLADRSRVVYGSI